MASRKKADGTYPVGYGKPPPHTRFTKGQSGNPNGRPKGAKSLATEIQEELDSRVPITGNGKFLKITKRKAVAKQLVNKSAAGDFRAMPTLLNQIQVLEGRSESDSTDDVLGQPEDALVMEGIIRRIREATLVPPKDSTDPHGPDSALDPEDPSGRDRS
jgi:hypothetical protein